MLKIWQMGALCVLGVALWGLVTYGIHANPTGVLAEGKGLRNLVMGPVGGVVSVALCKLVGRLANDQIVLGVAVVGAVAMAMDGVALRWFPGLYAPDEAVLHLVGADLLWGYGVAFAAALAWQGIARGRGPARARPA